MYEQRAVIKGRGGFPLDMLRYDSCCPYSENDSYVIQDSIAKCDGHPWSITVVRYVPTKDRKWAVARWQSFAVDITPGPTTKV
jgi:hypothetical protein